MDFKTILCGFWLAGFCAFSSGTKDPQLTQKNIWVFIAVFLAYLLLCYAGTLYRDRFKPSDKNNQEPASPWTADS